MAPLLRTCQSQLAFSLSLPQRLELTVSPSSSSRLPHPPLDITRTVLTVSLAYTGGWAAYYIVNLVLPSSIRASRVQNQTRRAHRSLSSLLRPPLAPGSTPTPADGSTSHRGPKTLIGRSLPRRRLLTHAGQSTLQQRRRTETSSSEETPMTIPFAGRLVNSRTRTRSS